MGSARHDAFPTPTPGPSPQRGGEKRRRGIRPHLPLLIVCLGTSVAPLDFAINMAFPSIAAELGRETADVRWIVIAYVLTYSSLLLIFGKLGDLVGYRIVFQAGMAVVTAGLTVCTFASSFGMLLAGRMTQGVGVSLLLSCAPALMTTLYPESERTRVLSIYAGMTALGGALGPFVGGVLLGYFHWSAVFWWRLPIAITALLLSGLIPARPGHGTPRGLDPIGSVQLVGAMCALSLSLAIWTERMPTVVPLALVAAGAILATAFVRRQAVRAIPIIRPQLFRDPVFSLMNAANLVINLAIFSFALLGPFYLLTVARLDTWLAGLVLGLGAIGTIVGSWLAPRAIGAFGVYGASLLGLMISASGLVTIAMWSPSETLVRMAPALLAHGIGLGLFQVAYTDFVTATLPIEDRGVAGSLAMLTRTMGLIGGAAGHALLHRHFERAAAAYGAEAAQAFMAGFRAVFAFSGGLLVLATLCGLTAAWHFRRTRS